MKRFLFTLLCISVCAPMVSAEHKITPVFYVGGGPGIMLAPTDTKVDNNLGVGLSAGVGFSINSKVEFVGRISFYKHKFNSWAPSTMGWLRDESDYSIPNSELDVMTLGLDIKYLFALASNTRSRFYLVNGFGVGILNLDENPRVYGLNIGNRETNAFLSSGAGYNHMISSRVSIWFETRVSVLLVQLDHIVTLPINAGLKVDF